MGTCDVSMPWKRSNFKNCGQIRARQQKLKPLRDIKYYVIPPDKQIKSAQFLTKENKNLEQRGQER